MPRDYRIYLEDMREAGAKVRRYVEGLSFEAFAFDDKTIDAVVRNLEILGEAAKQVPESFRALHPQVDWYRIAGLRDILIHQYFGVDLAIIWDVIQNKIPTLMQNLEQILLPGSSENSPQ